MLALFDLDGTLVDSAPDIAAALDMALAEYGQPACGEHGVRAYVGNGASRLVHRAINRRVDGDAPADIFDAVYARFMSAYAKRLFVHSTVYPGVDETLEQLRDDRVRLGCVTNKPARFSAPLLQAAGLGGFFEVVVSGDSLARKKPHPEPLQYAAQLCDVELARTVMVGDSINDIEAAQNAGTASVAVSYGYAGGHDLGNADVLVDDFRAIRPALLRLFSSSVADNMVGAARPRPDMR